MVVLLRVIDALCCMIFDSTSRLAITDNLNASEGAGEAATARTLGRSESGRTDRVPETRQEQRKASLLDGGIRALRRYILTNQARRWGGLGTHPRVEMKEITRAYGAVQRLGS
jgi:hypothetical protein